MAFLVVGCGGTAEPPVPDPPPPTRPAVPSPKPATIPDPFPADIAGPWIKAGAQVGWMRFEPKWNMLVFGFADQKQPGDLPAFHIIGKSIAELPKPDGPFGLWLQGVDYTDERMKDVAGFQELRLLRFSLARKLTAEGVKEVRHLKELRCLDLGRYLDTDITDGVLAALAENRQLHLLSLAQGRAGTRPETADDVIAFDLGVPDIKVTSAAFKWLGEFRNLESLTAGGRSITDDGLPELTRFANLKHLTLGGASLTDEGLKSVARLGTLRSLDVSATKVTDAGVTHLRSLTGLESLTLYGTTVTGAELAELKALTRLRTLRLDRTAVGDAGLEQLGQFADLGELSLAGTRVTDAGAKHLAGCKSLLSLNLSSTRITDATVVNLRGLERLESLILGGTAVTDGCLKDVQALKGLKSLNLIATPNVTEAGVTALRKAMPGCQIAWGVPRF